MEACVDRISQPAAIFDLDKTVISKSSTLAFGRAFYQYGLISRGTAVRCMTGHLAYRMVGASHGQMERIRNWAAGLCCGWPVDLVREIVACHLDEVMVPCIYAEARALIAAHQAAGHDVIIVSASGHEVVDPIACLLGADAVIATRMVVEGGCYTGQLQFYAYGEAKAARIGELAAERGYRLQDCHAYSDSATDLPLLETVGHPHAVNPDRALRRLARQRGWPVLNFTGAPNRPHRGRRQREPAGITNRSR